MDHDTARSLWIGTFHSMSARILRIHADKLGYDSNFVILDASDQERMIKKLLTEVHFQHVFWTPKRLASSFSRWKDDGIGPDDITSEHTRSYDTVEKVSSVFNLYQERLRQTNCMDFGDLLGNCLTLWQKHPATLEAFRSRFIHVLVDEYQDTNKVQYEWMKQIAAGHGNLCVVGDDDQSIYSWRGARLDNILRFKDDFPKARIVRLEQNYRSSGNILKAASQLINHNSGRMDKTLWTEGDSGPKLVRFTAEDGKDEARFVAQEIARQCRDSRLGTDDKFGQVAVLVRASWQTRTIEEALSRELIPYRVSGGLRFMDRAEIKDAVAYIRLAFSARDDLAFERIINVPKRKIGPSALGAIQEAAKECGGPLLDGARQIIAAKRLGPAIRTKLQGFIDLIDEANRRLAAEEKSETVLDLLLEQSGYNNLLETSERKEDKKANLKELRAYLAQEKSLAGFLERAVLDSDPGDEKSTIETNKVVISTLHSAKGLEFPIVFLVGLEENLLPHKRAVEEGEAELEEERRLMYVGMTRAKEKLYLSHARRRFMFSHFEPATVSRFLKELPIDTIETRGMRVAVRSGAAFRPGAALRPKRNRFGGY